MQNLCRIGGFVLIGGGFRIAEHCEDSAYQGFLRLDSISSDVFEKKGVQLELLFRIRVYLSWDHFSEATELALILLADGAHKLLKTKPLPNKTSAPPTIDIVAWKASA